LRIVESHYREMKEARMGHIARRLVLLGVATIGVLALTRGGSKMHHKTTEAPQTAGRVLHRARWYDLFGRVISFGRDKAIREKLIELAAPAPGEKVLDVGCGTGTLALALRLSVGTGEVHGIDASPEMIEVAKEKAAKVGSDIDFQVALIEAIPFPAATFDLVTSSLMLHHLPDDLKRTGLAEIRRVLKPGGRFMAMDYAAHNHSPLGHLLSIFGHSRGESMVDKPMPMLKDADFSEVEGIPTRHKNFAFIRAR
jgi:ubiquinone/menaquinone biosynthesis C-methylase UbiE